MNAPYQSSPPLLLDEMSRELKHWLQETRALAARHVAAWLALVGTLVFLGLLWRLGWPFVAEGGVTRMLLALATLVFGQALSFCVLLFYLRDKPLRLKRLTDDSSRVFREPGSQRKRNTAY